MLPSSRSVRLLTVLLAVMGDAIGYAEPRGSALLSPTTSSGISSLAVSGVSGGAASLGASYDATGVWHLVIADQRSGEIYDDVDTLLTQQPDGTITFCGECEGELFTLTPRGARRGSAIPYELSYFGEGSPCNGSASGAALLDTRTDSIKAPGVHVTNDDCSRLVVTIRLTRTTT